MSNIESSSQSYFYETDITPHDFEINNNNVYTESSANSIINSKEVEITFKIGGGKKIETYDYLIKSILPYLKQIIPSTAIIKVNLQTLS